MSPASRAAAVGPLMNKLRAFLLRKFAHAAIAAGPSTFDMAQVLDGGGLCLARLPKGLLGLGAQLKAKLPGRKPSPLSNAQTANQTAGQKGA